MKKGTKKYSMHKLLKILMIFLFLFSIIKIGNTFAITESFSLVNVVISEKSSTADVSDLKIEKNNIINDIIFHQVGDSVTYKITIKNNEDKSYTIKSVSDNNENKYISYLYDSCEGTILNSKEETAIEITEKYAKEVENITERKQNFSVNITITLEDEDGNVIETTIPLNNQANPKTGDDVVTNMVIALASLVMLKILAVKRTVKVRSNRIKKYKAKTRKLRNDAVIMNNTIQTNKFKSLRTDKTSRKNEGKHYGKHGGKGFKLFSFILLGTLIIPTISKASANYYFTITFENNITLKDKLIVSYKKENENYEIITKYNELVKGLENPEINGYNFKGWTLEDRTDFNPDTTRIVDDITIVPNLKLNTYSISYDLNGGTIEKENPGTYTVETDDIVLNKPTKEGYVFVGWTGTELKGVVENVTIAKGSTGNREYTANWTKEDYTIEYHLNGGLATGNPTTYTIESNDITLKKPIKFGYTFTGWTGTKLTDKAENVTIVKGATGNREYTANYTPTNYTITYKGLTEEEESALNNPTTYNIETSSTTLNNPENRKDNDGDETQRFVGWKEDTTVSTNITIPAELGNKEYEAIWVAASPNVYTVTYDLDGGIVATENRTSFTKFDTFTLNNPTKQGYTFAGWTGSNIATPETAVTVPTGTRENLSYIANWNPIEYTISYELNGGTATGNPTAYTIESNDITLNNPTKLGYTFNGWLGTDLTEKAMEVTILTGSTENREYTANWQANTYNVIFDRNTGSGSMANQEMIYNVESNLNENIFTKTGYSFVGWNTKADGTGTTYTNGQPVKNLSSGTDIKLYAQWTIATYNITYNLVGGTVETANPSTYTVSTNDFTLNNPSKTGYTFKGWSGTDLIGDTNITVTIVKESTGDRTYTANWQVNTYNIAFDANGGSGSMTNQTMTYDISSKLKANTFTKTNYMFEKWNTKADGTGTSFEDQESVKNIATSGTITLYAIWKERVATADDYVQYNIAYTDMYSDTDYTFTNGWKLLDYTDNGDGTYSNVKLISTGVPAMLYYSYKSINNDWWESDLTKLNSFVNTLNTTIPNGGNYKLYSDYSNYPALKASAGLYECEKFYTIEYKYGSNYDTWGSEESDYLNKGYFKNIINNTKSYNSSTIGNVTGADLFKVDNAEVRVLTLPEVNKMMNKTKPDWWGIVKNSTIKGFSTLNPVKGSYWLASPYCYYGGTDDRFLVGISRTNATRYDNTISQANYSGIRPIIILKSNVEFADSNKDGVWEIK